MTGNRGSAYNEVMAEMASVIEECEVSIMDIYDGYINVLQEEGYLEYAKKTMLMLLEKACDEDVVRLPKEYVGRYSRLDEQLFDNELEYNVEQLFENIMYAYGWECENYDIPYMGESRNPYDEIYEVLEDNGMEPVLLDALRREEILEFSVDSCFERNGILTLWKNELLSDIIVNNRIKKLAGEKKIEFEFLQSKFVQMKWRDPLAHCPFVVGKDVYFCYMDGVWYDNMGVCTYSNSLYLKLHVPLYAALMEKFIQNNF